MKTYLKYGGAMAGGGFVIVLVLYLIGLHSDAAKLNTAQWIQMVLGTGLGVACIVLATRERRAAVPPAEGFGYGSALGTGVMVTLFAAVIGIATNVLYVQLINPAMPDLIVQAQVLKWEAAGMGSAQIEQAEGIMRKMMHPVVQTLFGFIGGMVFGTVISLITAAFLKREATEEPPALP
jgi:Protein of unknown function (DUF4199)